MLQQSLNKHTWYERLLNIISSVKPGEGRSTLLLTLNACLLMFAYYLLKVIREPLILAYGGAEYKSYATALQASILLIVLPLFSVLYHRYAAHEKRCTIINKVLLFFISNILIFAVMQYFGLNVGMAFYVWLGIFSVMVVAQFWAYAADSYNVITGQRLFVILAVGATFGAWLGARIAGVVFPIIGVEGIMALAAALLFISVLISTDIEDTIPADSLNHEEIQHEENCNQWLDGFSVVLKNHYLMMIAVFVVILIFINSTGEYILARLVKEHSVSLLASQEISNIQQWQGEFYSSYYSWITLGSFVLQLFLVSRLFKWVGLRGAMLVLPVIMIIGYGLMLFFPVFSLIRIVMTAENSANYSVQNTTRHALFLPIPRKLKYLGKTTIETFFYRFGDLLYGAFIFVGIQYFEMSVVGFIFTNLILAIGLFVLGWKVGHYNSIEVQKNQGNSPPKLMALIPRLSIPSGHIAKFSISETTFVDPDVGDFLSYDVCLDSGKKMPKWIEFDSISRTFTFNPPADFVGNFKLKVTASDFEGLTASTKIMVDFFHPLTALEEEE